MNLQLSTPEIITYVFVTLWGLTLIAGYFDIFRKTAKK